ncbi:hypothetical protein [Absidia glauca]|uniref:Uncharacterized protein n=1 Tax=Absidia glauca TaxID=4829 RepID=A0A168QKR4_ABSGL|nr:hypothetical protein [Absidia glauca]
MSNKTFTQQRAILRPNKNAAFFADDDDDEDDDDDLYSLTDDGNSSVTSLSTNADTLVLAQFLASTGPEEFLKPSKKQQQNPQFRRASRLFNRLRKKGAQQGINTATMLSNVSTATKGNLNGSVNSHRSGQTKTTHMPLPVYQPTTPEIPLTAPNSVHISNPAIHATPHPAHPSSNKNMAFLSHQPKPRQRHTNHHQEQTVTPTKSTSSSSVTSHNAPNPSTSRSSSSNASRRQLSMRDSGVYSDFSEKEDMIPPVPAPSLPVKSQFRSSQHHTQPKRPAPLPASVASAAIASATAGTKDALPSQPPPIPAFNQRRALSSTSASADRRSVIRHSGAVPAAALKRRSVRIRHIQVQTDQPISPAEEKGEHVCSHCHQPLANGNGGRRTSCPSILPNGQLIPKQPAVEGSQELLEMIEHLKAQLAQEQHSRLQLEQAMSRQQETAKKIDLVQREKDRWKGDCLWLNDRIALLPE